MRPRHVVYCLNNTKPIIYLLFSDTATGSEACSDSADVPVAAVNFNKPFMVVALNASKWFDVSSINGFHLQVMVLNILVFAVCMRFFSRVLQMKSNRKHPEEATQICM